MPCPSPRKGEGVGTGFSYAVEILLFFNRDFHKTCHGGIDAKNGLTQALIKLRRDLALAVSNHDMGFFIGSGAEHCITAPSGICQIEMTHALGECYHAVTRLA